MSLRDYDHVDIIIGGTLRASDSFSVGLTFGNVNKSPLTVSATDLDTFCGAVNTVVDAHVTTTNAHGIGLSASGQKLSTRCYFRQAGISAASLSSESKSTVTGSNTAAAPNQVCAVHSLLTARAGRSNRGRVYWPWLASTGTLTSTNVGNLATEMAALLTAINGTALGSGNPATRIVVGRGASLVTKVRVDDVLDTQRRRRDKQTAVQIATATV